MRMIFEGSCNTEDWSNDAETSALITGINYIYSDKNLLFEIVILFQKITVFTVFMNFSNGGFIFYFFLPGQLL